MMQLSRMLAIARKESIQLRRDPRSMVLAFVLPLFLLLFFGYAISWDIRDIRIAVVNEDGGQRSRQLIEALEGSTFFSVARYLPSRSTINEQLATGGVSGVLVIPSDFSTRLLQREKAPVQLLLDGADANTATIALNYADAILARYSQNVLLQGQRVTLPATVEPRVWYNPTLASRNMIVPGLIAVIMSIHYCGDAHVADDCARVGARHNGAARRNAGWSR
jgi:ABC-2 type transport system permease protein